MAGPRLTDGRVILREIDESDLPAIDAGTHDPDVVRWIGPAWPIDEVLDRLAQLRAAGSPTFAICEPDGACVGLVWMNVREPDTTTGFVGYWLLPAARGRGLATRAVRLLSAWALREGQVTTVRLTTAPDNEASQRVAERSGFRRLSADGDQVVFELERPPVAARARRPD